MCQMEGPIFISVRKYLTLNGWNAVVSVVLKTSRDDQSTSYRIIFRDSFDLDSYRARSTFGRGLLEALENFTRKQLSKGSVKRVMALIHRCLLDVIAKNKDTAWEPLEDVDKLYARNQSADGEN